MRATRVTWARSCSARCQCPVSSARYERRCVQHRQHEHATLVQVSEAVRATRRAWTLVAVVQPVPPASPANQGFKVLLSILPLGARKQSYIRTRHSLWTSTWVLLINNYHTLYMRQKSMLKHKSLLWKVRQESKYKIMITIIMDILKAPTMRPTVLNWD